jgi:hypothetical protein
MQTPNSAPSSAPEKLFYAIPKARVGIYLPLIGGSMRRISILLGIATLVLCVAGWAGEIPLASSSIVPGAVGKMKYEHDRNRNIKYEISTEHLPTPQQLSPAKNDYVVWLIPRDGQPQNAGVLTVNNDLKGSFSSTTPAKAFDIKVTAEDNPNVTQISGPEILHGSVQVPQ